MRLQGTLTDGLGRGARYVGMDAYQDRFEEAAGFRPYPGTLNLEVSVQDRERFEDTVEPRTIETFTVDGDAYSAVEVYPAHINDIQAAILRMAITDHPDTVAELIAPVHLRDALTLKNGDTVTVQPRQ